MSISNDSERDASVTQRLNALRGKRDEKGGDLPTIVYDQLKQLAHRQLARESGTAQTLSTTALVHEAWLQLDEHRDWVDRGHFYRYAATAMRHILVDQARRRMAGKHGAGAAHVDLDVAEVRVDDAAGEILALDRSLADLERTHPALGKLVELRFFAGLSVAETASSLAVSERSVVRNWRIARAMIHRSLELGDAC